MDFSPTYVTEPDEPEIDEPSIDETMRVHEWRAERLRRLGLPHAHAELFADIVDWHAVADLVARGCAPVLALEIVH
jgi:hypothetical protein